MVNILVFIVSFSTFLGAIEQVSTSPITGNWRLVCYQNLMDKQVSCRPSEYSPNSMTFEFIDDGKNGQITGNTINNGVEGKYQLNGQHIFVNDFSGTLVMEYGWGSDFLTAIEASSSYKIRNDSLTIFYDKDSKSMIFIPFLKPIYD
jgi:heat shock protein HslJ